MIGYKAFNSDLSCRGFQYEIGKTYETERIGLCESGFHFCRYPAQVFRYYPKDSRMCLVEAGGKIIEGYNKCACSKITIIREITGVERWRINYGNGYGEGYGCSDGDGYGNGYGEGYGCSDGDGYGYGNGNGYGEGYGCGYGNGNGNGDGYDDGNGNGYGNGDGNGYGDGYGCGNINNILIFKEG